MYQTMKAVMAIENIEASTLVPGERLGWRQIMFYSPLVVKRYTSGTDVEAFPQDGAIGFVFVSCPIRRIGIPLNRHIPHKASYWTSIYKDMLRHEPTKF